MNDPWLVAGKIVEAIDALSGNPESRPGVSALREEIARLKAINAKLGGTVAKKSAEVSNLREAKRKLSDDLDELRKAQTRGGQAVELQRQHEEIRDLRGELNLKEVEIKELKGSLEYAQKAAKNISKNNAQLREQVADLTHARDAYRQDGIDPRDVVLAEIRRALDDYDNEED